MQADWSYLTNYLTTDHRTVESAGGLCYETLVVEVSTLLNWYMPREGEWWDKRADALQHFIRFLSQVGSGTRDSAAGVTRTQVGGDQGPLPIPGRVRLGLGSGPCPKWVQA